MRKLQKYVHFLRNMTLAAGLLLPTLCAAGTEVYATRILNNEIKTLRVRYAEGNTLERPFLVLPVEGVLDGSDPTNTLDISFDCLSHDTRRYTYTVLHLNHDYRESSLSSFEYLDGFTTQDITEYELSVNTQEAYTHYSFAFPNEDMRLKASGNYVLLIYEDGRREEVVAEVCFQVAEDLAGIVTHIRTNTDIETNGRYQQADIDVLTERLRPNSPDEIILQVEQNGRTDNRVTLSRPTFVENNRLRYINQRDLIFEGGNEYRRLDIYSVYFTGTNVDRVIYDEGGYHATLFPDRADTGGPYIFENDADGQFVVNAERTDDDDTEAEYMRVYWTLPMENPFFDGSIYIGGDLFQNRLDNTNRMLYDADRKCYFFSALLKQGGYDYQYWFKAKHENKATLLRTEGSYWQTNNIYTISVYYRPIGARYDRLVGLAVYSSSSR